MRQLNPVNLGMVRHVATRLEHLREQVVFVGGTVVDFLITDEAAPPSRSSMDVDVIFEITSLADYHALRNPLIELGFVEDSIGEYGGIYSWKIDKIKVDIMPTNDEVLGFSNEWYIDAIETAQWVDIPDGPSIRCISAPCFLMTKLAAFINRGNEDFMGSRDIEDVIAVIDGRPEIINEIRNSQPRLIGSLAEIFQVLLENEDFNEAIHGNALGEFRYSTIKERIQMIASIDRFRMCRS
ncbi:MAG: hypothetical protein ACP5VS_06585 [Desulfomonilaceae bacterium]